MKAVAVVSIKGGTGKTLVASNLAMRLAAAGRRLGVIDADIDSPSLPKAFAIPEDLRIHVDAHRQWVPVDWRGMKVHSMGLFASRRAGVTQPGELHRNWLKDTVAHTEWGDADLFVIDLPAGSGDEWLAVREAFKEIALVVVAVPRQLESAERVVQVAQFHKVRILGVLENMRNVRCPRCGEEWFPLGHGTTEEFCRGYGLSYLGSLPMSEEISGAMSRGEPVPDAYASPLVKVTHQVLEWASPVVAR